MQNRCSRHLGWCARAQAGGAQCSTVSALTQCAGCTTGVKQHVVTNVARLVWLKALKTTFPVFFNSYFYVARWAGGGRRKLGAALFPPFAFDLGFLCVINDYFHASCYDCVGRCKDRCAGNTIIFVLGQCTWSASVRIHEPVQLQH